jgi:hypothetical protein
MRTLRLFGRRVLLAAAVAAAASAAPLPIGLDLDEATEAAVTAVSTAFGAAAAAAPVVNCPANTFYWGTYQAKAYCVNCAAGKVCGGCLSCAADPTATKCLQPGAVPTCEKGQYQKENVCHKCPLGKWNPGAAAGGATTGCYLCPKGMFQPYEGMHSCYKCPVGQFGKPVAAEGNIDCKKCDMCEKGQYGTTQHLGSLASSDCSCHKCQKGKYTPEHRTTCFNCPHGSFQPSEGLHSCYTCPAGKFQSELGQEFCYNCPEGRYAHDTGAKLEESCTKVKSKCAAGRYVYFYPQTKTVYCVRCPVGFYGREVDGFAFGGHCFECEKGKYSTDVGLTECKDCPLGKYSEVKASFCLDLIPPTPAPTAFPSAAPSAAPTKAPTTSPTTDAPTKAPTTPPTIPVTIPPTPKPMCGDGWYTRKSRTAGGSESCLQCTTGKSSLKGARICYSIQRKAECEANCDGIYFKGEGHLWNEKREACRLGCNICANNAGKQCTTDGTCGSKNSCKAGAQNSFPDNLVNQDILQEHCVKGYQYFAGDHRHGKCSHVQCHWNGHRIATHHDALERGGDVHICKYDEAGADGGKCVCRCHFRTTKADYDAPGQGKVYRPHLPSPLTAFGAGLLATNVETAVDLSGLSSSSNYHAHDYDGDYRFGAGLTPTGN